MKRLLGTAKTIGELVAAANAAAKVAQSASKATGDSGASNKRRREDGDETIVVSSEHAGWLAGLHASAWNTMHATLTEHGMSRQRRELENMQCTV